MTPPDIAIIIPAHNEAALIAQTVDAARHAAQALDRPYQLIVVADACTDDTAAIAAQHGATIIHVDHRQIAATRNAGAAQTNAPYLYFLDADTTLPAPTLQAVYDALEAGAVAGGTLIAFDTVNQLTNRLLIATWNFIARTMKWAAGSSFFARRDAFESVSGFDTRYFAGEELFLSEKLNTRGPFVTLPQPVITSSRKLRTHTLTDHFTILFRFVCSGGKALEQREQLHVWYDGKREDPADINP